jgi:membrane dipeptidase
MPKRTAAHTALASLLLLGLAACASAPPPTGAALDEKAKAVHARVFSFDAHEDIPLDWATPANDPGKETKTQNDLPKLEAGGLGGAAFAVFTTMAARTPENDAKAVAEGKTKFAAIQRMAAQYPDRIGIAEREADIEPLRRAGKKVAVISMLNAYALGSDLKLLEDYYGGGLRMIGFTHAGHNDFADSSRPRPQYGDGPAKWNGLSPLGLQAIAEMNRLGIILDVSQLSDAATMQAIEASRAPVVASHSGVRALRKHERNLTDEEIKAIAAKGGVVHIVAFSNYLLAPDQATLDELAALLQSYNLKEDASDVGKLSAAERREFQQKQVVIFQKMPQAGLKELVDQIDYVVKLVGIDHVGIGTDFNHGGGIDGWKDASQTPNVTRALLARGYSERDIAKIWGGNFRRVWRAVEKVSAQTKRG